MFSRVYCEMPFPCYIWARWDGVELVCIYFVALCKFNSVKLFNYFKNVVHSCRKTFFPFKTWLGTQQKPTNKTPLLKKTEHHIMASDKSGQDQRQYF